MFIESELYSSGAAAFISKYRSGFYPLTSYCWVKDFSMYFRVVPLLPNVLKPPVRTVTYYSSRKGKRKTVKAVIYRFLRLHSGLWLRRKVSLHTVTCLEKECEVRLNRSRSQPVPWRIFPPILPAAFTELCLSPGLAGISSCQWIRVKKTFLTIHITKYYSKWRKSSLQDRFIPGLLHVCLVWWLPECLWSPRYVNNLWVGSV